MQIKNTLKVIVPDDLESSSEQIKVIAQHQEVVFNEKFSIDSTRNHLCSRKCQR